MSAEPVTSDDLPSAELRTKRRWSLVWLLPIVAVALSGWLLFAALGQRGIGVEVHFQQGYGIKPGDALRYRGIGVGQVHAVRLASDLQGVRVTLRIDPEARDLTRLGSQFWIVRPQLDLSGAVGLETVVGAKYMSVLPGKGDFANTFVGLEEPPPVEILEPGGLEIVLVTPSKGSLRTGAPVSYRQVIVGTIMAVELASDASAVEARIYIKPNYHWLIRDNVKFWKAGGARFSAGLTGLSIAVDSVQSLILGGVELAIPPEAGEPVSAGYIFSLYEDPEPHWLRWLPSLPEYQQSAFAEQERPRPVAAILSWQYKNLIYITGERRRRGWLLPVQGGFLGPLDLLQTPTDALADSARLALADNLLPLNLAARPYADGLGILPADHGYPPWTKLRPIDAPEDSLVIAAADSPARLVAASRYRIDEDERWTLDPSLAFDEGWHGACVVAKSDGAVIGILLINDDDNRVARVDSATIDEMPLAQQP